MRRLATLSDFDAAHAIYMDEGVMPYLKFDPMPRADFVGIMDERVASKAFFVVEEKAASAALTESPSQ